MIRHLTDRQLMEEIWVRLGNIQADLDRLHNRINYLYSRAQEPTPQIVVHAGGMSEKEAKRMRELQAEVFRNDQAAWYTNAMRDC